jgi:hypothetical protein
MDQYDDHGPAAPLAHFPDQLHEVAHLLQRPGLVHAEPSHRSCDDDVHLAGRDRLSEQLPPRGLGEAQLAPGTFEHTHSDAEGTAGPGCELAAQLRPVERTRPLVLDQEHARLAGDWHAEPLVAGSEVAGKVNGERRLPAPPSP